MMLLLVIVDVLGLPGFNPNRLECLAYIFQETAIRFQGSCERHSKTIGKLTSRVQILSLI